MKKLLLLLIIPLLSLGQKQYINLNYKYTDNDLKIITKIEGNINQISNMIELYQDSLKKKASSKKIKKIKQKWIIGHSNSYQKLKAAEIKLEYSKPKLWKIYNEYVELKESVIFLKDSLLFLQNDLKNIQDYGVNRYNISQLKIINRDISAFEFNNREVLKGEIIVEYSDSIVKSLFLLKENMLIPKKIWYENGQIIKDFNSGKQNDWYYDNGQLITDGMGFVFFKSGKDKYTTYSENYVCLWSPSVHHRLIEKYNGDDNVYEAFYDNGYQKIKYKWSNNKGTFEAWHANGEKKSLIVYGRKSVQKHWFPNGKLAKVVVYANNSPISEVFYWSNGNKKYKTIWTEEDLGIYGKTAYFQLYKCYTQSGLEDYCSQKDQYAKAFWDYGNDGLFPSTLEPEIYIKKTFKNINSYEQVLKKTIKSEVKLWNCKMELDRSFGYNINWPFLLK